MSTHIIKSAYFATGAAILLTVALLATFFTLEPQVSRAVDSNPFTITQTIDSEISFVVQPGDVTMQGSINGLTGGNATGTTFAVVQSNSASGYTLDIKFSTSGPAMRGNVTDNRGIRDYGDNSTTTAPDYTFSASTSALFAFTANSSSTLHTDFQDNGAACGVSGSYTANRCWTGPVASDDYQRLVDHTSSAPNGATTTITFKVNVPNAPTPTLDSDTYTATATLTALNQ